MNEPPRSVKPLRRKILPALLLAGLAGVTVASGFQGADENPREPSPANSSRAASLIKARPDRHAHARVPAWVRVLKPRVIRAKTEPVSPPGNSHRLVVKFVDSLSARANHDNTLTVNDDDRRQLNALKSVADSLRLRFRPLHTAPAAALEDLQKRAALRSGQQQPDPLSLVEVRARNSSPRTVLAAAKALLALDAVEYVEIQSKDSPPPPPAADISPATPSLVSYQTYRQSGQGIGVDFVWNTFGIQGHPSLRITDCEYSFNPQHEDLSGMITMQQGVSSMYSYYGDDHGTAATGVLAAANNGYGMSGAVPNSQIYFYPEYATMDSGYTQSRTATVTAAIAASAPGDIVMLEMQTWGPGGGYGPAEYDSSVWYAVKMGTDAGVIIIAAAGNGGSNGGKNLDSSEWSEYRSRGDSGAILVGAGSSSRSRLSYSCYGSRVDLQGWGTGVASTGYGSLGTYGEDANQKYTSSFNGTSSATPIVASAAALIQSVAIDQLGRRLSPTEMRSLLVATGNPQTGSTYTRIGPLPDLTAAVPQLLAAEFSSSAAITIPDSGEGSPFPSTIHVSGVEGVVSSVRVRFDGLNHSEPRNLDILLVGPGGQVAYLMSDAGSFISITDTSLTFDDTTATVVPESSAIVPGRYRPANYGAPETPPPGTVGEIGTNLTALAANGANGDWKLYVADDFPGDSGSLASWSISFETLPTVSLASETQEASEDDPPLTITATLSKVSPVEVSVPFTVSGTATAPDDFSISAATIIIPVGQTTGSVTITPVDDTIDEPDESIVVTMDTPANASTGAIPSQVITIHDNDVVLSVTSAYGAPSPEPGSEVFAEGEQVSVTVVNPYEQGPTRHRCRGWRGTGSVPPEGSDTTASFCIKENSTITWNWETEYQLDILTTGDGTVDKPGGWHPEGTQVTMTASAGPGSHFAGWTISPDAIVAGSPTQSQIIVELAEPVSVTAVFLPIPPAVQAFGDWASSAGLAGSDAQPSAIPFGENTPNLLKYAFNLSGSGPDVRTLVPGTGTAGLPCLTFDTSSDPPVCRLEYLHRKNSGLTYHALEMTDPGNGPRTAMVGTVLTTEIDLEWDRVVIEQPFDPESLRRFFTVEVTLPGAPP